MDINTLKYKITKFDEGNRVIFVEYDDGSHAAIQLPVPVPTTKKELDEVVRPFAPTVELLESVGKPNTDLSYIKKLVGKKELKTDRRSTQKEQEERDKNNVEQRSIAEAFPKFLEGSSIDNDRDYIKAIIREELLALGVTVTV